MSVKKFVKLVAQFKKKQEKLSKLRDEMRDIVDDLHAEYESVWAASSDFEQALELMESAIDEISQYV